MSTDTEIRPTRHIAVCGDLVVDHHIYEGKRATPTMSRDRGVRHIAEVGGAEGIWRLLHKIDEKAQKKANTLAQCTPHKGVRPPDMNVRYAGHHAFAIWQQQALDPKEPDKDKVWRTSNKMGYGHDEAVTSVSGTEFIPEVEPIPVNCDVLILDDAGYVFRTTQHAKCWHLDRLKPDTGWIVLKMSEPVARGALWHELTGQYGDRRADRTLCLVSAKDLRNEPVQITSGSSWESVLEDLSEALKGVALAPLNDCRHLVVVFGTDAALWIDRDSAKGARFCFAPAETEGDYAARYQADAIGHMTAMASALSYGLAQAEPGEDPDVARWIEAGLHAMRHLLREGHGKVGPEPENEPQGYPVDALADVILSPGPGGIAHQDVKWPCQVEPGRSWVIAEAAQRPINADRPQSLIHLASTVLCQGSGAYGSLPHAKFGDFVTMERSEVEMLRGIKRKMSAYKEANKAKADAKPLAIGVFGPPGAGKSFAVREIAKDVFGKEAWLEFNLSQFNGIGDFNGALQQVRDAVLKGLTPVVFWDEFDSEEFEWLRYLLAPLQDGRFQDGPLTHGVGRSVFVFAGGTSWRFENFGVGRSETEDRLLRIRKVSDFKSRLDAFYNVIGPNRRWKTDAAGAPRMCDGKPCDDLTDAGFTLRRALLIRGQLGLLPNETLNVDADLLRALLLVPRYHHGARSLEKLVKSLPWTPGTPLLRSALPLPAQLDMYMDAKVFGALMTKDLQYAEAQTARQLARLIHTTWRINATADGTIQPHLNKDFDDLEVSWQEDNIESVRRIPAVLALAGLGIEETQNPTGAAVPSPDELRSHLEHHMGRLAEAEHDGCWRYRERNGWRYGPKRDDERRIHDQMKPYAELSADSQARNRESILAYEGNLASIGYRIIWLSDDVPPTANDGTIGFSDIKA